MKDLRAKIDQVDKKINKLLDERASIVREIGKIKKEKGKTVFSPDREKKIIEKIIETGKSKGALPVESKIRIFNEIIAASRALQKKLKISFLGPEATYTHLAAVKQFSRYCRYIPSSSIPGVFRDVEKRRVDYGVVPVENSTEGIVSHTLDMFLDSDCKICAELLMNISHSLLSKSDRKEDIKTIYSHPQALAQSSMWLEENMPGAEYVEVSSTATAAKRAVSEKKSAAIASLMAADIYKLNIIETGIENASSNVTRFFVIGKDSPPASGDDKTSVMFSIKDRVGALHDMLVPFKKNSINLTKIESRPSKMKAWEYVFFIDMEGHIKNEKIKKAVEKLQKDCVFLKVLGSYPAAGNMEPDLKSS
ncbi:MAG: prephenate dehydratase [Elusimicrobiota bacterium]